MLNTSDQDMWNWMDPSSKKKRKRGATKMGINTVGQPITVEVVFNKRGQAIGKKSIQFASTYQVITREHIPIIITN